MDYYDDDDEEVGARRGRRRRRRRRARRRARRAGPPRPPAGRPETIGKKLLATSQRTQPLGLGTTTIAAGTTAILQAVAQRPSQFNRMIVGASVNLDTIEVNDIKMGTRSQLTGVEGVPGPMFRADAWGSMVMFDPIPGGITVSVTATNNDAQDQDVNVGFYGGAGD